MRPEIRLDDYVDRLCEIAASPSSEDEEFGAVSDLLDEFESELMQWAEAHGADVSDIEACRRTLRTRIAHELGTNGLPDRVRSALEWAVDRLSSC